MSFFESIEMQPDDPILGLLQTFLSDPRKLKVNLGIGAYKTEEGNSYVLSCVQKAEEILLKQQLNKDYPPILGNQKYIKQSLELLFGEHAKKRGIAAAQTVGATGALRVGGEFLRGNGIADRIFISDPSWSNHFAIFRWAKLKSETFPYFNAETKQLDFSGMCAAIEKMPAKSAILLQPCCHNPTGIDPTFEQWQEIAALIQKHQLIPFFDLAYLGFDKGVEEDASVIRHFAEMRIEFLVALSYSKNFGLYGERVGLLAIVTSEEEKATAINSNIKQIIRGNYSMPPLHGSRIVETVLNDPDLRNEWLSELETMRNRIKGMRQSLISGLKDKTQNGQFNFLEQQTGMFSFSGLNGDQVAKLQNECGVYMTSNGRMNVAGLNSHNLEHVVSSILSVSSS